MPRLLKSFWLTHWNTHLYIINHDNRRFPTLPHFFCIKLRLSFVWHSVFCETSTLNSAEPIEQALRSPYKSEGAHPKHIFQIKSFKKEMFRGDVYNVWLCFVLKNSFQVIQWFGSYYLSMGFEKAATDLRSWRWIISQVERCPTTYPAIKRQYCRCSCPESSISTLWHTRLLVTCLIGAWNMLKFGRQLQSHCLLLQLI